MRSRHRNNLLSSLTLRLIGFCPLFLVLPVLAESFALPMCPVPKLIEDRQLGLLNCDRVKPDPPAATEPAAAQALVAERMSQSASKELDAKTVVEKSLPNSGNPPPNPTRQTLPPDATPPSQTPLPTPSPPDLPTQTTPAPSSAPTIDRITVSGNTILTPAELDRLVSPSKGQPATQPLLCKTAQGIARTLRERGYVLAQAYPVVDRQTQSPVTDGEVKFLVTEGCLESIDITGTRRLKPNYINSRLVAGAATPFNGNKIDDLLALLRTDPNIAKLEVLGFSPGKSFGTNVLSIRVTEANSLAGFVGSDAYMAPIFGGVRVTGGLIHRNATGNRDDLSAVYFRSISGEVQGADFSYSLPLNPMNGQLLLRYAPNSLNILLQPGDIPFTSIGSTTEITYRQPLIRTPREKFALSLGFAVQDERATFNGEPNNNGTADPDGNTRTRVIKFGQEYNSFDSTGNWNLRSMFNLGLGDFAATLNPKPTPDGRFFSWQAQAQRVQRFTQDNYAIAQLDFQLTPDSLLPSQQFNLSGDRSIRGYRQNIRSGDNGIRFSLEDRTIIGRNSSGQANLQLLGYVDSAQIWNTNGSAIDRGFLAAMGVGIIWEPFPRLITRIDYGIPLVDIVDRGYSFQDSGFNFSIGYGF